MDRFTFIIFVYTKSKIVCETMHDQNKHFRFQFVQHKFSRSLGGVQSETKSCKYSDAKRLKETVC